MGAAMNKLLSFEEKLAKSEAVLIGIMLLIISFLAFLQVLTRYVFFYSIVWSEEVTRYLMVWLTFIGAALAISKQDHINIDMFTSFFKKKTGRDFRVVLNFIIFVFSIGCSYFGAKLIMKTYAMGQLTEATRVPMYLIYVVMEVAILLMAFHAFVRLIDRRTTQDNKD